LASPKHRGAERLNVYGVSSEILHQVKIAFRPDEPRYQQVSIFRSYSQQSTESAGFRQPHTPQGHRTPGVDPERLNLIGSDVKEASYQITGTASGISDALAGSADGRLSLATTNWQGVQQFVPTTAMQSGSTSVTPVTIAFQAIRFAVKNYSLFWSLGTRAPQVARASPYPPLHPDVVPAGSGGTSCRLEPGVRPRLHTCERVQLHRTAADEQSRFLLS
jgi:hypothetical protein